MDHCEARVPYAYEGNHVHASGHLLMVVLGNRFAGIDGSAYIIGGFGMTALTANNIVLVPIRSGIGLRLGANIGYLKYTPRATWNPF